MRVPNIYSHKFAILAAVAGIVTITTTNVFADPRVHAAIGVDVRPSPGVDIRLGAGNPGWRYGHPVFRRVPVRPVIVREARCIEPPRWGRREEFYRGRERERRIEHERHEEHRDHDSHNNWHR